jgi:D-alanyl-D-alanine carboxypeptidase
VATLANVESELAERIRGMQTDAGNQGLVLVITTGYRSLDEQWRLYNDMIEAKKKYGKNWQKYAALAAYPGTSDHGRNPATAVDLACASATKENIARHGGLATKWGLARTVPSEYWHLQLARSRGSVPAGVPTEQEVRMIAIEPVGTATNRLVLGAGFGGAEATSTALMDRPTTAAGHRINPDRRTALGVIASRWYRHLRAWATGLSLILARFTPMETPLGRATTTRRGVPERLSAHFAMVVFHVWAA